MKDQEILEIFARNGLKIELGERYSVKGQIAQLLNGCKKVLEEYSRQECNQTAGYMKAVRGSYQKEVQDA